MPFLRTGDAPEATPSPFLCNGKNAGKPPGEPIPALFNAVVNGRVGSVGFEQEEGGGPGRCVVRKVETKLSVAALQRRMNDTVQSDWREPPAAVAVREIDG